MPDSQVTKDPYTPGEELESLINNELEDVRVSYTSDTEIDLPAGLTAQQRDYEMTLRDDGDEFVLSGTETASGIGMFLSLEGHLGFAAGIILSHALILGQPTQIYTDEGLSGDPVFDEYQDLTAEWYQPAAVDNGLPEARLSQRTADLEATKISLNEIERYARHWLSLE